MYLYAPLKRYIVGDTCMKKILSVLLALTLVFSLGIFVYAEDTGAASDAVEEVVEEVVEEAAEPAAEEAAEAPEEAAQEAPAEEAAPTEAPAKTGLSGANKGLIAAAVLLAFGGILILVANKKIKGPKKSDK